MKSLLPAHFPQDMKAFDEVVGDFMNKRLHFTSRFFYIPTQMNAQLIANTFDIDIRGLKPSQSYAILKSPMLSKSQLGTKKALKDSLSKVIGDAVIQTRMEDKKLKPFEFSLKTTIDEDINEESIKAINNIINEIKPLRDSCAGLDFAMPLLENEIKIKTSILWRL